MPCAYLVSATRDATLLYYISKVVMQYYSSLSKYQSPEFGTLIMSLVCRIRTLPNIYITNYNKSANIIYMIHLSNSYETITFE